MAAPRPRLPGETRHDAARLIDRELAILALSRPEQEHLRRRIELRLRLLRERLALAEPGVLRQRDRLPG